MERNVTPPKVIGEKCINCGQCVSVCPSFVLDKVGEKTRVVRGKWCIDCGHCGAVCPTGAILHETVFPDLHPGKDLGPAISPEILESLLLQRRSVRSYTKDPVPENILRRVLDVGTYGPTGRNSQNVHYIVLRSPDQISQLRKLTTSFYAKVFARARGCLSGLLLSWVAGHKTLEYLRESLPKAEYAYEQMKKGKDPLFFHAPVVILAHGESWDSCSSFNCSVALYHCSLLGHTLGLGCCFNGYLVNAVNHDRKVKKWLGIPSGHQCYAAMTLGYQDVTYRRPIRRDPPKVIWR
jgi:ferredoxin